MAPRDPAEWLNRVDVGQALKDVQTDVRGDWYRDPWAWPELEWAVGAGRDRLANRFESDSSGRAALLEVAKENFVVRPAVVLDPIDRLIYEALVGRLSPKLLDDSAQWVYGWRLNRSSSAPGLYERRDHEWGRYRNQLQELGDTFESGLTTDIVSFFASIPTDRLAEEVVRRCGTSEVVDRLVRLLSKWAMVGGRSGLAQRCNASSMLANMYLRPVDDVLAHFGRQSPALALTIPTSVAAGRWMDDIWLFADDPAHLRMAQVQLQHTLYDLGLHLSAGKTAVLEGDHMRRAIREMEHSAVDEGLNTDPRDEAPLSELIEALVSNPEQAPSTSIRFATVRLREHSLFEYEDRFIETAPRMPHGSPYLSRLFRDSERWRELDSWYADYAKSKWGEIEWAVAQLGTMFPTNVPPSRRLAEVFEGAVDQLRSVSLFAVAAQRLSSWDPQASRSLFREAARRANSPHLRRILALAGLNAGEERQWVRDILGEYEENLFTLKMLEDRNFRRVPVTDDFEANDE